MDVLDLQMLLERSQLYATTTVGPDSTEAQRELVGKIQAQLALVTPPTETELGEGILEALEALTVSG